MLAVIDIFARILFSGLDYEFNVEASKSLDMELM